MTYTQGLTLLVNMFFNPVVNAAQSLASQVNSALLQFSYNFTMAANPQITRLYATGEISGMKKLVDLCSKISYVIMLFLALPFILRTDYVLGVWLIDTPEYTAIFLKLLLGTALVASLSSPIITAVQATGDIKKFQLGIAFSNLFILPISYVLFRCGFSPSLAYWCMLFVLIGTQGVRVYFYSRKFGFSIKEYFVNIALRAIVLTIVSYVALFFIDKSIIGNFLGFIILCCLSVVVVILFSYLILLNSDDRTSVKALILRLRHKNI